jgi:hypothetical protein
LNVRRGEGTVSGEGTQPVIVKGGEEASIGKEVRVSKAGPPESKPAPDATLTDAEREAGIPGAAATELRGYGEWVWTSEYGYAWRPYVADDWAPYYYGRWAWVYPYGWNWVGYEPWGWWPYHYGWWVSVASWGWVWAPCNTFYSAGYYYRGYPYGYRYAYYNPANVRFVNDGRYVRWVPERPGQATTRRTASSRTDTRLAQWDRPMPGGTITSRGSGGRGSSVGGQVTASPPARRNAGGTGRETVTRSAGQKSAHPFPEGGGRVSAVPAGSGAPGRSAGGGKALSRYSTHSGPARAPVSQGGMGYGRGGGPSSASRGYAYPSTRGYGTGYGGYGASPRGSVGDGYRGAPGGAARSFGGGGSRGYSGGSRDFGGGSGGGWGGGGRGGGFSGGGGGRTR